MLACEVWGVGAPVVLIHAFPLSSRMWLPQLEALEKIAQIILPDIPGLGRSPRQVQPSLPEIAKDVNRLLDHLKIKEPVFIGGLSMGGYVTFEFLRQFPERVRGLGLFSTRPAADTPEARERRMQGVKKIKSDGLEPFAEKVIPNLIGKTSMAVNPERVRHVRELILTNRPEGVIDALLAMAGRRDSTDLLASIRCPTLVIAGDEDSFVPLAEAESFARRIPKAEFHVIPKAGHLTNLEDPPVFRAILEKFLTTHVILV